MDYQIATTVIPRVSLKVILLLQAFSSAIFRICCASSGPSASVELLFCFNTRPISYWLDCHSMECRPLHGGWFLSEKMRAKIYIVHNVIRLFVERKLILKMSPIMS